MNTEKVQRDFERQIADNGFVFAGYTGEAVLPYITESGSGRKISWRPESC